MTIRLTVPGELRYRDVAIRAVTAACRLVGAPDRASVSSSTEEIDLRRQFDAEVVSAVSEIFNNIAIHGYQGRAPGDIVFEMSPRHDAFEISISDTGLPFDIEDVPAPPLEALPEGGMGIHIARACVDRLDYTPGPPNVWHLTKHLEPTASLGSPA